MGSWIEQFRSLGLALIEVFKAEFRELGRDLSSSGRQLGIALGLFGAAAVVGFWTLAVFLYFLIQLLARLGLPLWGAAGLVTALLLLVLAILAWLGTRHLKRVENSAGSIRRRVGDHKAWWEERMLPRELPTASLPAEESAEESEWEPEDEET